MCGILVSVYNANSLILLNAQEGGVDTQLNFSRLRQSLRDANSNRGPDHHESLYLDVSEPATVQSTDLRLSGNASLFMAEFYASELRLRGDSPIQQPHKKDGNILCWNGEIFDGLEVGVHENDGVKLMQKLCSSKSPEGVRDLFGDVEGPYAFAYYHAVTHCLYFGRDPLGRRSLLIHKPTSSLPCFFLSSVSSGLDPRLQFEEVSTEFIYCLDLDGLRDSKNIVEGYSSTLLSLTREALGVGTPPHQYARPCKVNDLLPPSTLLPIQSLNSIPEYLIHVLDDFISISDRSVWLQARNILPISGASGQARVSILFSGGIDSTFLTYLVHKHVPLNEPIDLLNVAFENPRKIRNQTIGNIDDIPRQDKRVKTCLEELPLPNETSYRVPDRMTGLQELEELRRLCPSRIWNFVEINVPYKESQDAREIVETLMLPSRTVMDLSLALALYFASRGQGQVRETASSAAKPYTSPARVVISGLGSDELLGGYSRHRTAFSNGGWESVTQELQLEIDRLPLRNLGRDDRVISSHGKETRHPFLSLDVVSFLAQLPVHYKLDPRLESGIGDKMLLRLAAWKLGLFEASTRKKRAMQFGSRSARMNGERRGDVDLE